jgi:hypothetical protein
MDLVSESDNHKAKYCGFKHENYQVMKNAHTSSVTNVKKPSYEWKPQPLSVSVREISKTAVVNLR